MWLLDTYNVYLYKKTQLTTAIKSVNPTGKQKDTTWRQDWLPGSLPAASRITENILLLGDLFQTRCPGVPGRTHMFYADYTCLDSLPSSQVSRSVDWTLTFCRPTLRDDTRFLAGSSTGSAPLTMHFCVSCLPCPTNARPTSQHPCGPCRHILSTMWLLDTYNV